VQQPIITEINQAYFGPAEKHGGPEDPKSN
jgi:hypothetical protein